MPTKGRSVASDVEDVVQFGILRAVTCVLRSIGCGMGLQKWPQRRSTSCQDSGIPHTPSGDLAPIRLGRFRIGRYNPAAKWPVTLACCGWWVFPEHCSKRRPLPGRKMRCRRSNRWSPPRPGSTPRRRPDFDRGSRTDDPPSPRGRMEARSPSNGRRRLDCTPLRL